ncbi:MAG TPA: PfkB family carbohydrate kinase, partial [Solirubrobacteraceae bacterium]|nr:PfkB family carbohydrate kinase [Solirubrobacteraceae bacterium]
MAAAPRIAVVGSANIDLVARCERLPRAGETVSDALLERFPGGKGANQAIAAARLGASVRFIGRIGADDLVLRSLERDGVDTSGVVRDEGEGGVALVLVGAGGGNMIVVAPGANARVTADDVDVGEVDAVMCQLEVPAAAVRAAAARAPFFCLNAAPARGPIELEPDLLVVN